MPIYIGDYLSATSRLTTEQHGAYFLLLMDYWKNGAPPDDDRVLTQITRMSPDAWSNAKSTLQAYFKVIDRHWKHDRVERELSESVARKVTASTRAKAGAAARWGATSTNNATSNTQAMPNTMLGDASSPSPSPSSLSLPLTTQKKAPSVQRPDGVLESTWVDFIKQRKAKKATITETALKGIEREALKAGLSLDAAMQEMCARGWAGFKAEWLTPTPSTGFNRVNGDVAALTTPSKRGRDPALLKIDEDMKNTAPPSPEILAKIKKALQGVSA